MMAMVLPMWTSGRDVDVDAAPRDVEVVYRRQRSLDKMHGSTVVGQNFFSTMWQKSMVKIG